MRKLLIIGVLVLLAIGAGVGITWYVVTPHTPEAQFAVAEKAEKALRAEAATKQPKELQPKTDETIELYRRVTSKFGKNPKSPEALKHIAKIHEEVEKNIDKAMADLDALQKDFPGEDTEGFALLEEARLIKAQANDLKGNKKDYEQRYRDALAKLDDFMKKFDKSPKHVDALMESGRIWMDGIEQPPIHPIEILQKVLADFPHSIHEPEAMYRLGQLYERIKEFPKAVEIYARLLEEYPKSDPWAPKALDARGRLLAEQMDQHDQAAKDFEKLAQDFPNAPEAQGASGSAQEQKTAAAEDEGKKYGQSRYGGAVPLDTTDDKPVAAPEIMRLLAAQKLDAETYDLTITFAPEEHKISVTGTLKLTNRGDEKKALLLILEPGLKVTSFTADGAAVETQHKGETLQVPLASPLAKDAAITLGFTYSGQYADADMMKDLMPGPGGGTKGSRSGTPKGGTDLLKNKPAPDITLKTFDGKDISLGDQHGKVVVVDMWATWCQPCRESLPHLQKLADNQSLAQRGLVVWAVNDQEKASDVEKYLKDNKLTLTVPMDARADVLKAYNIGPIPTTVVIGRDAKVKDVFIGYGGKTTDKELEDAIEKALNEPAPSGPVASAPSTAPATRPANLSMNPQLGLGEYGYGLSGGMWYPITIIGDIFDAHVVINTPANIEAVANGVQVSRQKSGGSAHFEYQTKNPVFGLYFAYGPYVVQDKQVGDIHFYTYLRTENKTKHDAYVEVANRILSFYSSKFAPFPFEKMAIIDTPLPPFLGGVGPASLMFLQNSMVDHPEVPETLLAHELAHQWFGNLVPLNVTDPNYNQWLSEGFATYSDALYTEFKDGPQAFRQHIEKYQQLYFQLSMTARPTAIRDTHGPMQALYRPIVYEKGALVLHMLRKVMGDDKFFQLMRQYVTNFRNKPSTTDDFRKLANDIYGKDLSWFFAQWYDRTVYAHWKVTAVVSPDGAGSSTKITITQPDELVTMPADVTVISDKGDKVILKDVMLDKKENVVEAKTTFVPVKVIVDEDNWVLKRPGADNIWTGKPNP